MTKPKHGEWWVVVAPNGKIGCVQFNVEGTAEGRWMHGDNWFIPSQCRPVRRIDVNDGVAA